MCWFCLICTRLHVQAALSHGERARVLLLCVATIVSVAAVTISSCCTRAESDRGGSDASERRRISAFVIHSGPKTCARGREPGPRGPLCPIFCAQFAAEECEWRPRCATFGPPIPHGRRQGWGGSHVERGAGPAQGAVSGFHTILQRSQNGSSAHANLLMMHSREDSNRQ